jgi:hypothetical protein
MHVAGRQSTRYTKGKQVPMTSYLPPQKYWLLRAQSSQGIVDAGFAATGSRRGSRRGGSVALIGAAAWA